VKRPGRSFLLRQVILDDLVMMLLCFSIFTPLTTLCLLGMLSCFLSLHTIYELGYRENDLVAETFEARPNLSTVYPYYRDYPLSPGAWIWGLASGLLGVSLLHLDSSYLGGVFGLHGWMASAAAWLGVRCLLRAVFWLFNHSSLFARALVFPLLHLLKTGGFVVLLSTSTLGLFLVVAQVVRTWANYVVYRCGGDKNAFPTHFTRFLVFEALVSAQALGRGDWKPFLSVEFWVITAWCTFRAMMHVVRSARAGCEPRAADAGARSSAYPAREEALGS
jgi:hypothetical protein